MTNRDPNCLFCKIIDKEIPAKIAQEGETYLALYDINPQAPLHILVLPKQHLNDITECQDAQLLQSLFQAAAQIANQEKLNNGFRLVINTGVDGGQTVNHLHIHLLGGRALKWPPG